MVVSGLYTSTVQSIYYRVYTTDLPIYNFDKWLILIISKQTILNGNLKCHPVLDNVISKGFSQVTLDFPRP